MDRRKGNVKADNSGSKSKVELSGAEWRQWGMKQRQPEMNTGSRGHIRPTANKEMKHT